MAKQQKFGGKAVKTPQRKMAKVVMAQKTTKGTYSFREVTVDQDKADEFIKNNRIS